MSEIMALLVTSVVSLFCLLMPVVAINRFEISKNRLISGWEKVLIWDIENRYEGCCFLR